MKKFERERKREYIADRYDGPKKVVYKKWTDSGYYLPGLSSPAVNREYLRAMDDFDMLCVQKNEITEYRWANFSKEIAYCVLEEIALKNNKVLNFDILNMPSKQWMINVAYYLDPLHYVFIQKDEVFKALENNETYQEKIEEIFSRAVTKAQIETDYKTNKRKAYKAAIKARLVQLNQKYACINVNLNHNLLRD
jgi:hypothetical protein